MEELLTLWESFLSQMGYITNSLRMIGWWFAKGFKWLIDTIETGVDEAYGLLDFTQYSGLEAFFSSSEVRIILACLLAGGLIVYCITLMASNSNENPPFLKNVMRFLLVLLALPTLMTTFNDITTEFRDSFTGSGGMVTEQVLANNIVDLVYIDGQGFDNYVVDGKTVKGKGQKTVNGFTNDNISSVTSIDPAELASPNKYDLNNPEFFSSRIEMDSSGNQYVAEIETDKLFSVDLTNWYYRYSIDYSTIYLTFTATAIALLFTMYKVVRLIYELVWHQTFSVLISATDLTSGERTKQVLKSLGGIYAVLMLMPMLLQLFFLGQIYLSENVTNSFLSAIFLVIFAIALMSSPNVIERTLGVDAGSKKGMGGVSSMMFMFSNAVNTGKSLFSSNSSSGGTGSSGGNGNRKGDSIQHSNQDVLNKGGRDGSISDKGAKQDSQPLSIDQNGSGVDPLDTMQKDGSNGIPDGSDSVSSAGAADTSLSGVEPLDSHGGSADLLGNDTDSISNLASGTSDSEMASVPPLPILPGDAEFGKNQAENISNSADTVSGAGNSVVGENIAEQASAGSSSMPHPDNGSSGLGGSVSNAAQPSVNAPDVLDRQKDFVNRSVEDKLNGK